MRKATLMKAKPENLKRLANFLKLKTDGMSHRQIVKLVRWLLTRREKRIRNLAWYY
jgi:hypothetical protein